jgi:hypothetical protein
MGWYEGNAQWAKARCKAGNTHFTGFTGTKVQILTLVVVGRRVLAPRLRLPQAAQGTSEAGRRVLQEGAGASAAALRSYLLHGRALYPGPELSAAVRDVRMR